MLSEVIIICIFDWVFRKLMEYNRHFILIRATYYRILCAICRAVGTRIRGADTSKHWTTLYSFFKFRHFCNVSWE
jgi:hypothetical protein